MFLKRKKFKWIYDALYIDSEDNYFPVYDQEFETPDQMDEFIFQIMAEEGLKAPFQRLSCHQVGHLYERE